MNLCRTPDHQQGIRCKAPRSDRRMEQYAARPPAPLPAHRASRPEGRAYASEGEGAIQGNAADDALLAIRGLQLQLTVPF